MCVIVTSEAGTMPTVTQLAQMSDANPGGAGIAWYNGQQLHRYRNPDNRQTLAHILANWEFYTQVPFLLHFRLAPPRPSVRGKHSPVQVQERRAHRLHRAQRHRPLLHTRQVRIRQPQRDTRMANRPMRPHQRKPRQIRTHRPNRTNRMAHTRPSNHQRPERTHHSQQHQLGTLLNDRPRPMGRISMGRRLPASPRKPRPKQLRSQRTRLESHPLSITTPTNPLPNYGERTPPAAKERLTPSGHPASGTSPRTPTPARNEVRAVEQRKLTVRPLHGLTAGRYRRTTINPVRHLRLSSADCTRPANNVAATTRAPALPQSYGSSPSIQGHAPETAGGFALSDQPSADGRNDPPKPIAKGFKPLEPQGRRRVTEDAGSH